MSGPHQPGFSLGVDLGTSNTVAVVRAPDGRTRPLLFDGQPIMPSGVYLDQDGRLQVGRDAQRMAQLDPARFEPNPKRRIDERTILLGDREVPTTQLLAALLRTIADKAVEAVGYLPQAVITHPAAWGAPRRGVLAEAVRQAGWPPVRMVPEPVAAARYFAQVMRRPVPVGSSVAVFDFGGGTLDVAVVRHQEDGTYAVTASGGDESLGGLDLDAALVAHVGALISQRHPQIWQHLSTPQSTTDRRYRRLFWEDVRGAKEMLSRTTAAPVPVPGVDQAVHLTREELEKLAAPLLERAVRATQETIGRSGQRAEDLSGLFLVGGSSRVPAVGRILHARLGVAPTVLEQPELPVAEGSLAELAPAPDATAPMTVDPTMSPSPAPYPVPAGGTAAMPVSTQPGQASPVSAMPTSPPNAHAAPMSPPPGPYPPQGPVPSKPWYRRKAILIPSGAAVLVLVVVAGFLLLYNPYQERPFVPLTQVTTIKYPYDNPYNQWSTIDGDTAYLGTTECVHSCGGYANRITVSAIKLGQKKPEWTKRYDTPNGKDWLHEVDAGDGVVVLTYGDTSGGTNDGGVFVLDETNGAKLWSRQAGYDTDYGSWDNDAWSVMSSPALVMHYKYGASTVTAYDATSGHVAWTVKGVKGIPWFDQSYDDYSGPSTFTEYTNAGLITSDGQNSSRLVFFDGGRAQVRDADDNKLVSEGSVSNDGARLVYDGVLYDASTGNGYRLSAYSLDSLNTSKWSESAPNGWKTSYLAPCGTSLICASEYKASAGDGYTEPNFTRIRAIDTDTGNTAWTYDANKNQGAVPVGNRILVSYWKHGQLDTDVLDHDGHRLDEWRGEAARVDDASALVASGDVFNTDDASGYTITGSGVQSLTQTSLGTVSEDLNSCAWNDTYLVCADGDNSRFVVSRFRS